MTQFFKLLSCYMPKIIQRSMLNIYLLKYQLTTQYIHIPFFQKQIIRTLHTCKLTSYPFPRVFHLLRFWEVQKRLFQDLTKYHCLHLLLFYLTAPYLTHIFRKWWYIFKSHLMDMLSLASKAVCSSNMSLLRKFRLCWNMSYLSKVVSQTHALNIS